MAATGLADPVSIADPPSAMTGTYREFYSRKEDVLAGSYEKLYSKIESSTAMSPTEIYDHYVTTSEVIPKVFLTLVDIGDAPRIITVHRPNLFPQHPLETSRWDGSVVCFLGDLMPGNSIKTRILPSESFNETSNQRVPTVAAMDALLGSLPPEEIYLPPPGRSARDTELVQTRNMIQVPHRYIPMVLNKAYRPRDLWRELAGAIRNDGKATELEPLLTWIRVACTGTRDDEDGDASPKSHMGPSDESLPPLDIDEELQTYIWKVLCQDIPALASPDSMTPLNPDPALAIVRTLREENELARAEREAERRAKEKKDADKLKPSKSHPSFYNRWMRNCDVAHEDDLELVYHQWCKVKAGERRLELQAAIDNRASQEGAAGRHPPIVTKELTETTYMGNLGAHPSQVNDLTKGIHPFTCGFISGSSPHVAVRIEMYDSVMQGNTQPTVAEQAAFSKKEVPLPATTYECGSMLRATSLFIDTVQGETNPHAEAFRAFCTDNWPDIEDMLQQTGEPETVGNVLPRILRAVQINMVTYFNAIAMGRTPSLPDYAKLTEIIQLQEWSKLQSLPITYLIPRDNPPTGPTPIASLSGGSGGSSGGPTGPKKTNDSSPELGEPKIQPDKERNEDWIAAFASSGKTVNAIRKNAPKIKHTGTGKKVAICLSWHLKGRCFEMCTRRDTHHKLDGEEKKAMAEFVAQECKNE